MKTMMLSLCLVPLFAFAAEEDDWAQAAPEKFESGERAFQAARRELLDNYLTPVSEDDLYRAAVQGMLAAVDPPMRKYNRLLGPGQFADLHAELKGEVVGIGVRFKLDSATGRAEVLGIVPGSPAAASDVREGDLILTVDGQPLKGKTMLDVVAAIRGKAGDKVRLGLLRETAVVERSLTRARVTVELVSDAMLPGEVGVLSIRGFNETTPDQVRAALGRLSKAKSLVVDLRGNAGGVLEKAIDTAKLLLPRGRTIAKLVKRGGKEEVLSSDVSPLITVPTVVLTNELTGSSAELLAAALRDGLKAPLIGTRTKGKWSVQMLKELPNRYVMKYTIANFKDSTGRGWEGDGLAVDVEVPMSEVTFEKAERTKGSDRLALDGQLKAAASFLKMR